MENFRGDQRLMQTSSPGPDLQPWMAPAIVLTLAGLVWVLLRPGVIRFVFWLLHSEDGRMRFRRLVEQEFEDEFVRWEATADTVEGLVESVTLQGSVLREVKEATKDLPSMTGAFNRLAKAIEDLTHQMERVDETVTRMEEREKMRYGPERRGSDRPDTGQRRRDEDR
jgi:hypothetical protein